MESDGRFDRLRAVFKKSPQSKEPAEKPTTKASGGTPQLNISRRAVLRGGALVAAGPQQAAAAAFGTLQVALPEAVVARSAALLAPLAKLHLLSAELSGNEKEDPSEALLGKIDEEAAHAEKLNAILAGAPATDYSTIHDISELLEGLSGFHKVLDPSLTLSQLGNEEVITGAYKLAGKTAAIEPYVKMMQALGTLMQSTTGLASDTPLSIVAEKILGKRVDFVKHVIGNISAFATNDEKSRVLKRLEKAVTDPYGMGERIGHTLTADEEAVLSDVKIAEARNDAAIEAENNELERKEAARRQEAWEARRTQREKERAEPKAPEPIEARASVASSNQRKGGMTHTFCIKPGYSSDVGTDGLMRMDIELYRQSLYKKAGKLSEFRHEGVSVREDIGRPADGIMIDTSDPLLIEELQTAIREDKLLEIPGVPRKNMES